MRIRFLLLGSLNLIISNLLFQILLLINLFPVIISSLIYLIFSAVFSFVLYGKFLFRKKIIFKSTLIIRYLILLTFSWLVLNLTIQIGLRFGISSNISSLLVIPFLAINSYNMQKFWVFK